MLTIDECRAADRADPLADRRALFDLPSDLIYLDGNSLGPPTKRMEAVLAQLLADWRSRLIDGWWASGWVDLPRRIGSSLEPIVGAEPGSIICTDSTSVNLFKLVTAMCDLSPGDILTDIGNFPSCLYVLESIANHRSRRLRVVEPGEVIASIDHNVGVVSLSQVDFRSGRLHDMEAITHRAAEVGQRRFGIYPTRREWSRSSSPVGGSMLPSAVATSISTEAPERRPTCMFRLVSSTPWRIRSMAGSPIAPRSTFLPSTHRPRGSIGC